MSGTEAGEKEPSGDSGVGAASPSHTPPCKRVSLGVVYIQTSRGQQQQESGGPRPEVLSHAILWPCGPLSAIPDSQAESELLLLSFGDRERRNVIILARTNFRLRAFLFLLLLIPDSPTYEGT